jgi:hypothetical protein
MAPRRRMMLQLTSLVDLLFIVMFLQYMELQDASAQQVAAESARRKLAETARVDANRLKESALANTEDMSRRLQSLESENKALQDRLTEANKRIAVTAVEQQAAERRAAADMKSIAAAVKDMIGISPEAVLAAIGPAPEAERVKLRQRFDELRDRAPGELVRHLRETSELKKYSEVWEVHIASDNSVSLKIGPDPERQTVQRLFVRSADELANRVVAAAKEQGEPKSLVIICLTWADADLRTREQVVNGLKFAVIALKPEWGGTKRIEFAKLGYSDVP